MTSFIKSLCRYLFEPKDPLEKEIYRLENAIFEMKTLIEDLINIVQSECICCYSCALGGKYRTLLDKYERQKEWLEVLKKKKDERRAVR